MIFSVEKGCFDYGGVGILRDLSFSVRPGEILAILGPNGVGKTTLLRCMMGFLPWKSGRTVIDGRPLADYTARELWSRVSYVPQAKGSLFPYTAREMVLLGRSAHLGVTRQPGPKDEAIATAAMTEAGIARLADKRCDRMSGGELQLVLTARALAAQPRLLVMDEPESNLDFRNQLVILDIIRHLAHEHGMSVIVNTHFPAHALKLSDKALLLGRGEANLYGAARDVITEDNMRRAFGVNVSIHDFQRGGVTYNTVVPLSIAAQG